MDWTCQRLPTLAPLALYQALALRSKVFVVEQQCVYLDPDGLDLVAWHLLGFDVAGELQACARLLPPHSKGPGQACPVIGRVVVAVQARSQGQGRALMRQAMSDCARLWPGQDIALSAQAHLQQFYASLGFLPVSGVYSEDGIDHIDMQRAH